MKNFILLFALALAISAITFGQNSGTINLEKGQKYYVENKINNVSSFEMMGQPMETNADITSTFNIEVKDNHDNNINLTNTITSVKMNVTAMGQDLNFDSEKQEDMNGEIGSNFKDYINKPKDVVMDKSGNVIIKNIQDATTNNAGNSSENPAAMMMQQMGGDPEEQGYGAKMTFHAIPKNAKTGSSWTDSSSDKGTTRVTNYILKEISGDVGKLSLTGTIISEVKTEMQGTEILTKTTGKLTGEEILDLKTGLIKQNTSTTDATGTVTVMGQEIPTSSKIISVTTVKSL